MCKPGSVLPRFTGRATDIRLGRWLPNASSASYPGDWDGPPLRHRCRQRAPLLALAPGGVCRAAPVTWSAVRSYRTVSPLPAGDPRAVYFLWHFPASHLDWPLASTLPYGARTFLPSPIPAATSVRPIHSSPAVINTRAGPRPSGTHAGRAGRASGANRGFEGCGRPPPRVDLGAGAGTSARHGQLHQEHAPVPVVPHPLGVPHLHPLTGLRIPHAGPDVDGTRGGVTGKADGVAVAQGLPHPPTLRRIDAIGDGVVEHEAVHLPARVLDVDEDLLVRAELRADQVVDRHLHRAP